MSFPTNQPQTTHSKEVLASIFRDLWAPKQAVFLPHGQILRSTKLTFFTSYLKDEQGRSGNELPKKRCDRTRRPLSGRLALYTLRFCLDHRFTVLFSRVNRPESADHPGRLEIPTQKPQFPHTVTDLTGLILCIHLTGMSKYFGSPVII